MIIDLYEMTYRGYKYYEKIKPDINIMISEKTRKSVIDSIIEIDNIISNKKEEIKFSDVICYIQPVIDNKNNLSYKNEFISIKKSKEITSKENIERFFKLDINSLPLIEVAKYLNIKVEKSNILDVYGKFNIIENKITIGSDYIPTFIHELSHAVDYILGITYQEKIESKYTTNEETNNFINFIKIYYFKELIAELSAIVLCKNFNISINLSYSKYYLNDFDLDYFWQKETYKKELINRVSLICEYINKCVENIGEKRNFI